MVNMKIKIFFNALLCVLLICGQSDASGKPLNQYLIAESVKLTRAMDSLAQSGAHTYFAASLFEAGEIIAQLGAEVYTTPHKAVLLKVSDETVKSTYEKWSGKLNLPDDVYDMIMKRACRSVTAIINSRQGANALAATDMLSLDKSFLLPEDFTGSVYCLLLYDKYCSATFFYKSGQGVMSASTTFLFLPADMKKAIMNETLAGFIFEKSGVSGLKIKYIDI